MFFSRKPCTTVGFADALVFWFQNIIFQIILDQGFIFFSLISLVLLSRRSGGNRKSFVLLCSRSGCSSNFQCFEMARTFLAAKVYFNPVKTG